MSRLGSIDVGGLNEGEDVAGSVGRKDLLLLARAVLSAASSTLKDMSVLGDSELTNRVNTLPLRPPFPLARPLVPFLPLLVGTPSPS